MMGFDGYDMSAWMWVVMGVVMVIVIGALIALVIVAVRAVTGTRAGSFNALEMLKRRLAAGEITPDEYEKTRRILEG